jgi:hypothetical protein
MDLGGFVRMKRNAVDSRKEENEVNTKEHQERQMRFEGFIHGCIIRSFLSAAFQQ